MRDLWTTDKVQLGIGSDLTFYSTPSILDKIYGSNPVSWKLFLRVRPGKMDMSLHSMHNSGGNISQPQSRRTNTNRKLGDLTLESTPGFTMSSRLKVEW